MFDVVTIGTATRDAFLTGAGIKVLKDPKHLKEIGFAEGEAECFALGAKLEVDEPLFTVGGGAANAAVTFARQGWKTAALVRVGNDEAGGAIIRHLGAERVKVLAVEDKTKRTAYSTILLTGAGERTVLVHRGAAEGWRERDMSPRKLQARWLYIAPGTIPLNLMQNVIRQAKARGSQVAMNPSGAYAALGAVRLKPLLALLDVVVVNREEASLLTGVEYRNVRGIFKKFDDLVPGIAVMTDGPRGAFVSDGKYLYTAGIFKEKKLVDRTGAGDAFGAGFVAGLMRKHDVHYALRLAAANATSVVERVGAETGILRQKDLVGKRWRYLDLGVEPL
ncbi:MAG: carbohydrate kinase family protein [Candidatus Jorgensenbacteria bacterium]